MFQTPRPKSVLESAFTLIDLIFVATVRNIRKTNGNAIIGLLMNILQSVIMVAVFWLMIDVLGMRHLALRGNYIVFLLSGIFLFMTHTKAVGAVAGAPNAASPLMKHANMNTAISITAAALSSLYFQILSMAVILFITHVAIERVEIYDWAGFLKMFFLAWLSGVALGLVLMALSPWAPTVTSLIATIYRRVQMLASGKMFLANTMGAYLYMFDWNPLFHIIDQARGYAFINYNPRFTNSEYPMAMTVAFLVLGMVAEFYTRKRTSLSWYARR